MPAVEISVAAAVAILDYNLLQSSPHRQTTGDRTLRAVALTGSAAPGDSAVSILVNQTEVARIYNSKTGFPNRDDLKAVGVRVPSNAEIAAIVVDAAATNPLTFMMEIG